MGLLAFQATDQGRCSHEAASRDSGDEGGGSRAARPQGRDPGHRPLSSEPPVSTGRAAEGSFAAKHQGIVAALKAH